MGYGLHTGHRLRVMGLGFWVKTQHFPELIIIYQFFFFEIINPFFSGVIYLIPSSVYPEVHRRASPTKPRRSRGCPSGFFGNLICSILGLRCLVMGYTQVMGRRLWVLGFAQHLIPKTRHHVFLPITYDLSPITRFRFDCYIGLAISYSCSCPCLKQKKEET